MNIFYEFHNKYNNIKQELDYFYDNKVTIFKVICGRLGGCCTDYQLFKFTAEIPSLDITRLAF